MRFGAQGSRGALPTGQVGHPADHVETEMKHRHAMPFGAEVRADGNTRFRDPAAQAAIPDPNDPATFAASKLRWDEIDRAPHSEWLALHRELLALRHRLIVPRLAGMLSGGDFRIEDASVLRVQWTLGEGSRLHLVANFAATASGPVTMPPGQIVYANPKVEGGAQPRKLPPWFVAYALESTDK